MGNKYIHIISIICKTQKKKSKNRTLYLQLDLGKIIEIFKEIPTSDKKIWIENLIKSEI